MTSGREEGFAGMQPTLAETIRSLANRRMLVMLLLGFASGLPSVLPQRRCSPGSRWKGSTSKPVVSSLVGVPYTFKFLWSPAMDRYGLVRMRLGRRRSWLVVTQVALVIAIAILGMLDPLTQPLVLGAVAVAIAFFSASQDIAFNAYQTEVLESHERGLGVAISVGGYRLGMLVSGGLSMVLADHIGWQQTFWVMSTCMAPAIFFSIIAPLPKDVPEAPGTASAVIDPFVGFFTRKRALALLAS